MLTTHSSAPILHSGFLASIADYLAIDKDQNTLLMVVLISAVALLACATCLLSVRIRFWWKEGKALIEKPGHATPPPPFLARLTRLFIARLMQKRYIGPLKVEGREHLDYPGRLIVLINHQTERDAIIVPAVLGLRRTRALMAVTQIHGIRTPLAAWSGIIAVHHDLNPVAAVRATIKILSGERDSSLVVFPQGKLVRDNQLLRSDFFDGAIMIAQQVAGKSELPLAILPAAIAYDRNPSQATLLHKLADFIGWRNFRNFYGDTIYRAGIKFGAPIPLGELPDKRKEAMDVVFDKIAGLSAEIHEKLGIAKEA